MAANMMHCISIITERCSSYKHLISRS